MVQRSELEFLNDGDFYVSQTRVTMMLHQPGVFSWRGMTGEVRTFPTRDVASVQVASDNAGCARLLGIALVACGGLSALTGLIALIAGEIGGGFILLVIGALLVGPAIVFRRSFFARTYYATLYTYGTSFHSIQSIRTKDRDQVRRFAAAVGEAISARDFGPST